MKPPDGGCSESQFLVITETDLVMFHADLEWYLPPTPACKLKLNQTQKIANITAIVSCFFMMCNFFVVVFVFVSSCVLLLVLFFIAVL